MKTSEKIQNAWENIPQEIKEHAVKEFLAVTDSGLYARLWLNTETKEMWATEAASCNDNIGGYDDANIILIFGQQGSREQREKVEMEDFINMIEDDYIFNTQQNREWDE